MQHSCSRVWHNVRLGSSFLTFVILFAVELFVLFRKDSSFCTLLAICRWRMMRTGTTPTHTHADHTTTEQFDPDALESNLSERTQRNNNNNPCSSSRIGELVHSFLTWKFSGWFLLSVVMMIVVWREWNGTTREGAAACNIEQTSSSSSSSSSRLAPNSDSLVHVAPPPIANPAPAAAAVDPVCRTPLMDPPEMELLMRTVGIVAASVRSSGGVMRMLEYGSGASTLHYSYLVDEYYSVEHNIEFCKALPQWASECNLKPPQFDTIIMTREGDDTDTPEVVVESWASTQLTAAVSHVPPSEPAAAYPTPHRRARPYIRVFCTSQNLASGRDPAAWHSPGTRPSTLFEFEDYLRMPILIPIIMQRLESGVHRPVRLSGAAVRRVVHSRNQTISSAEGDGFIRAKSIFPRTVDDGDSDAAGDVASHSTTSSSSPLTTQSNSSPLHFDVILIDGRARPQTAWFVYSLLAGGVNARIIVHDWKRSEYQETILQMYELVEEVNTERGLATLKRKDDKGDGGMDEKTLPEWWIG